MHWTIETLLLGLTYIATGGAVFTDWGKNHKALAALAAIVALITTGYFVRDRYLEWSRTAAPHVITEDVATLKFFDSTTAQPRVWYSKSQTGTYALYDGPGFDPVTGSPLQAVTPEVASEILSIAAAARAEERRRADEVRSKQQQQIEQKATEDRQRQQDAKDRARAQEQARQKADQDEIDRQNALRQRKLDQQRQQQEDEQRLARQREQAQNEWRRTHNGCNIGFRWACFDCQRTNAPECIHIGGNGGCLCVRN